MARQSLIKLSGTKFHENPFSGSLCAPYIMSDELSRVQNKPEKGKDNITVNTENKT